MKKFLLLLFLILITPLSFPQENYTNNQKNLLNNLTICDCLETHDDELINISAKKFELSCNKLFKDLGLSKVLEKTKNCDLDKISKIIYKDVGLKINSLEELNEAIAGLTWFWE